MRRSKEKTGERLNDLTLSNPVSAGFDYPHQPLREVFGSLKDFSYRPDPLGELHARNAVSSYYASRGISISTDHIALTASTSEAYSVLFKLLCNPGDEVLVPTPSYPLFDDLAALESIRAVPYRLLYAGGWFIDLDYLRSLFSPRTRAMVIVNPNNPTGSFIKQGEYEAITEMAAGFDVPLISDEVFSDYRIATPSDAVRSLIGTHSGLAFSLNGLSKIAGMPQMKLGWIAIHGGKTHCDEALVALEHVLDTYLSVGTPVQRGLDQVLSLGGEVQRQIRERLHRNVQLIKETLRQTPIEPLAIEGGWSAILRLPGTHTEEFWVTKLLADYNIMAQPGYFFDFASEPYLVISLLTPPFRLQRGIEDLIAMINAELSTQS